MFYTRLAAVAAVAAMLAATGCGKSSSTTTTTGSATTAASTNAVAKTGPPLGHTALIAKADAICKGTKATITTVEAKTANVNELQQRMTQIAAAETSGLSALSTLTPPASMANDWRRILAGAHTLAEETSELGAYLQVKDARARTQLSNISAIEAQIRSVARRAGFKDCAKTY